jgi:hypothetical protein
MGTLTLPTTGTLAGLTAVQDINAANAALATASQGGTAPTPASTGLTSTAGLLWHDTTNNLLKLRNQADTGWITVGSFDEGQLGFVPYYEGVALPTFLRGYIAGLNLSNDTGAPNTKIDVSSGVCVDDTSVGMMNLGTSVIDCTTVGVNGLDAGALAAATWYVVYAISKSGGGAPGCLVSLSGSPTFPAGYSLKRRIGSIATDTSAHIRAFLQRGNEFLYNPPVGLDIAADTTLTTANKLYTLPSAPSGQRTLLRLRLSFNNTLANAQAVVRSPDEGTGAPALYNLATPAAGQPGVGEFLVRSNLLQQISMYGSVATNNTISIEVLGWFDDLGRFN